MWRVLDSAKQSIVCRNPVLQFSEPIEAYIDTAGGEMTAITVIAQCPVAGFGPQASSPMTWQQRH